MIKKILLGILLASLSTAFSPNQAQAKPAQRNETSGLISGRQYLVLTKGARSIPDNAIYYVSCDSIDCDEIYAEIQKDFSSVNKNWHADRRTRNSVAFKLGDCAKSKNFDLCSKEMYEDLSKLGKAPIKGENYLDQRLGAILPALTSRTDFDGNYSINCPSSRCFIFSTGQVQNIIAYWI